jgi:hypothetical protein
MPKKLLWIIISSCILAAAAIAVAVWIYIYINTPIKFTAYSAKDGAYSINVPDGWMVAKNQNIFEFGGGLDLGVFSNMYVPNDFNFQASGPSVGSVLSINVFDNSQKSQDNLRIYFGQIGGLSADPEKYINEEIQKDGIKMKNVDGFYTLKHGFPVGIFRKNGLTFIMHGNISDGGGARMIEFMIESIR